MLPKNKFKKYSIAAKTYWREILAVFILLLAVFFFRSNRRELYSIIPHLKKANISWLTAGFIFSFACIIFQSGIYLKSFQAIGLRLRWLSAIGLYLKRNFLSIFLPAGSISTLAYTPSQLRGNGFNQTQIYQASGLYAFAGLVSFVVAAIPFIGYSIFSSVHINTMWPAFIGLIVLLILIVKAARSLRNKGKLYLWLVKKFPSVTSVIDQLFVVTVNRRKYTEAISFSFLVEITSVIHLLIAMAALGFHVSVAAAVTAYFVSIVLSMASPFLRGLGAVELSMVYILGLFGYPPAEALPITILYRVFEFWLPMLMGFLAFAWKGKQLFIRLAPALLIFALGIVNIISAITPPIHSRILYLREFIPVGIIHASNMMILFIGLALLVTSAYLVKGLRNAWIIAMAFSVFSLIGNLGKALDYEEATLAAVTVIILVIGIKQYNIRSNKKRVKLGFTSVLLVFAAVSIFGFISFYFIDVRHFGADFTWRQSILHTIKMFLLVQDDSLHPITRFGHEFAGLIRILAFISWGFLLYTLITPYLPVHHHPVENNTEKAKLLLNLYGQSSVDYFKIYRDKLYFFSGYYDAFIAYRIAGGFAIVLGGPVCAEENKAPVVKEFDNHCRKMGLKTAFYRVDENNMAWFNQLKKQKLVIGQEAILDVNHFSLEGKEKKSLRNAVSSLQKKGYTTVTYTAPVAEDILSSLKQVSDEWLASFQKEEMIFSQGMFDRKELQQQDIITLQDTNGHIKAFLNIIPDFTDEECTYDLIRKTNDAPGGCMDALILRLVDYAKEKKLPYINLGLAPMTGIEEPSSPAEQLVKYASEKFKRFSHYKGLRAFKEKYASAWENKYLVYENDFDLLQLPAALNKVMQVKKYQL